MNFSGSPSHKPFLGETPFRRHLWVTFTIAAAAFMLAVLFHGAAGSDRSGEGMVVLGLPIVTVPIIAASGALSFVFRRVPVISEIFGGICWFGTIFFGTMFVIG